MNNPVADSEARTRAIDPAASCIVQAPAGSGKTGLLIQRYLKLLSLVDSPEEIVAITFTRKAAAEMQNRILDAIALAGSGSEPASDHEKITYRLARAALARNNQLGWAITENPARLRIQTIDALCAVITRQMPVYSRLGAQPETLDDPAPFYEQAAINTLGLLESGDPWAGSLETLLDHLDNDQPRVKRLLIDMLQKRDQWLPHVTREHQREQLQQSLVNLIEDKLKALHDILPQQYRAELISCIRFAAKNLEQEHPDHVLVGCNDLTDLPDHTVDNLLPWQGIADLLLTRTDNNWRKQINRTIGFPPAGTNKLESDERAAMKKRLQGLIEQFKKIDDLKDLLAEVRTLPPAHYTDQEWEVLNALCQVLTLAAAELEVLFAEQNRIDFSGITQAAIKALGNLEQPSDLAMHLDYRINHLLVDEYQDISVIQYNLLQRLTAGWSQQDDHSLFLVGDPQQSIYRFREAEVGLFINTVKQQRLGQVPLVPLSLSVNFRSEQGIIDWVNECFRQLFPKASDVTTGAVAYSPSVATHQDSRQQHINIHPQFSKQGIHEATQIVEIIRDIRDTEPESTIAILVRSRTHLAEIVPVLKQQQLRFQAIELESLANQPAIQDLSSLTRACLHPADRIAWLAVLRAPWCGLELKALHDLFNDKGKTIWEGLQQHDLTLQHNPVTETHLQRLVTVFKQAFDNRQRKSLRQTIESIWCQLGGPATLASDNDLENAATFFDLLEQLDAGGNAELLPFFATLKTWNSFWKRPPVCTRPQIAMPINACRS